MAITRGVGPVYSVQIFSSTSGNVVLNGTTAGRMLVIGIAWQDESAEASITSITINGETNATLIAGSKAHTGSAGDHTQLAFHPNLTAGGNKTITVTFDQTVFATFGVMEYAGQDTTTQPDASNNAVASAADPTLSLTTVSANALIVALVTTQGGEPTAGAGYTLLGTRPNNSFKDEDEDLLDAGAAGAKTVNFTVAFGLYELSVASFKPAGGGGGRTTKNTRAWGLGMELGMGIWMPPDLS